jgi:hypothetical protein
MLFIYAHVTFSQQRRGHSRVGLSDENFGCGKAGLGKNELTSIRQPLEAVSFLS